MAERLDRRDTEVQCSAAQRQHNKTHYNAMQQGNETVGREQCHRSIAWRVISSDAKPAAQKGLRQAERKGASNLVFFSPHRMEPQNRATTRRVEGTDGTRRTRRELGRVEFCIFKDNG